MKSFLGVASILLMMAVSAYASQTGDSMKIDFTGRLITRTACTVNNNQMISVFFGNVAINKVATGNVIQALSYSLDCGMATTGNTVQMTINATSVPSDSAAMNSSMPGLWMRFLNEGGAQPLGKPFNVADWHNPPKLEIQLVKDPSVALEASNFTGVATLIAEYF